MDDAPFGLDGQPLEIEAGEPGDDDLEFIVSAPATGWTDRETRILDRALDLAGLTDEAERLRAGLTVDFMGIVILEPLVKMAEDVQAQVRRFFDIRQGGLGK